MEASKKNKKEYDNEIMKTHRGFDSLVDNKESNIVVAFAILNSHVTEYVGECSLSECRLFQKVRV